MNLSDYRYDLPDGRIAQYPLAKRSDAKLLVYQDAHIRETIFGSLVQVLPHDALVVMNNTRVIRARIVLEIDEDTWVEIFCLEPVAPYRAVEQALNVVGETTWRCMVGNNRKWKSGQYQMQLADGTELTLQRNLQHEKEYDVLFCWDTSITFGEILEQLGHIPLPPYMKRQDESVDAERYQTVFAQQEGAVAAPTAGLHFTPEILESLRAKGIQMGEVTLHVGAGTFLPVTADYIEDHEMHAEHIVISRTMVMQLLDQVRQGSPVVVVGTTSMRTLESLYWFGVGLRQNEIAHEIPQWVWRGVVPLDVLTVLEDIVAYMDREGQESLHLKTSLMIIPGYRFQICDVLLTNFHQPGSTLLMLVAAFIGEEWRCVYEYALHNDFRFLSYGDTSLLFRNDGIISA